MIKKILATLALVVTLAVGAVTPAAPAHAAASDCNGYSDVICLFAAPNYGLPIWRQHPWQINGCRNLTGFDNVTTVVWNNTRGSVQLNVFQYPNCSGGTFNINSGHVYHLSGDWWNDKISSVRVVLA